MKPAWECCSVMQARHSVQLAGDSVSLSPGDTNGALYGRGIPDTVAGSLLMQGCGLRGPAGHVAEELGPQVRKSSSSPRGDSAGWVPGLPWLLPQQLLALAERDLASPVPARLGCGSGAQAPHEGHAAEAQRLDTAGAAARQM